MAPLSDSLLDYKRCDCSMLTMTPNFWRCKKRPKKENETAWPSEKPHSQILSFDVIKKDNGKGRASSKSTPRASGEPVKKLLIPGRGIRQWSRSAHRPQIYESGFQNCYWPVTICLLFLSYLNIHSGYPVTASQFITGQGRGVTRSRAVKSMLHVETNTSPKVLRLVETLYSLCGEAG